MQGATLGRVGLLLVGAALAGCVSNSALDGGAGELMTMPAMAVYGIELVGPPRYASDGAGVEVELRTRDAVQIKALLTLRATNETHEVATLQQVGNEWQITARFPGRGEYDLLLLARQPQDAADQFAMFAMVSAMRSSLTSAVVWPGAAATAASSITSAAPPPGVTRLFFDRDESAFDLAGVERREERWQVVPGGWYTAYSVATLAADHELTVGSAVVQLPMGTPVQYASFQDRLRGLSFALPGELITKLGSATYRFVAGSLLYFDAYHVQGVVADELELAVDTILVTVPPHSRVTVEGSEVIEVVPQDELLVRHQEMAFATASRTFFYHDPTPGAALQLSSPADVILADTRFTVPAGSWVSIDVGEAITFEFATAAELVVDGQRYSVDETKYVRFDYSGKVVEVGEAK